MGLLKTVSLVVVAGAVGSMVAGFATSKVMQTTKLDVKHTGAVNTGITAGGAALTYVVLASVIG